MTYTVMSIKLRSTLCSTLFLAAVGAQAATLKAVFPPGCQTDRPLQSGHRCWRLPLRVRPGSQASRRDFSIGRSRANPRVPRQNQDHRRRSRIPNGGHRLLPGLRPRCVGVCRSRRCLGQVFPEQLAGSLHDRSCQSAGQYACGSERGCDSRSRHEEISTRWNEARNRQPSRARFRMPC